MRFAARPAAALTAVLVAGLTTVAGSPAWAAPNVRERSWHLEAMNVPAAQSYTRGEGVIVAVIDTGVDPDGPDLAGQVLSGAEISTGGTEGDGRNDEDGHGTGMASLIAGKGGDDGRLLGIAPGARILPVKITRQADGAFAIENIYRGVVWAVDHGAKVISMSLGGVPTPDAEWKQRLVRYAVDRDVVLVAAAGNLHDGQQEPPAVAEPASIPGVVAVSALNRKGDLWRGSETGPEVVVSAPGEALPYPAKGEYSVASGTSGATAVVAGVVALIRAKFPELHVGDVVNRLIRTTQDRGPKGRDVQYGFGAVDALAAVSAEVPSTGAYPLALTTAEPAPPLRATRVDPVSAGLGLGVLVIAGVALLALLAWITAPRFASWKQYGVTWARFTQRPLVATPARDVVEGSAVRGRPAQDDGN